MLKLFILMVLVSTLSGCSTAPKAQAQPIILGECAAQTTWIYLCGLTKDLDTPREIENRRILDSLGKKMHLKFVAITPLHRSQEFGNALCWPHATSEQILKTYNEILSAAKGLTVAGFIGFSNGGFFLNRLTQILELNLPVVSIGAYAYLETTVKNNVYLIIGKQDEHHYNGALKFYHKSLGSPLRITLIEHDGEHEVPTRELEAVLASIAKTSSM